MPVRFVAGNCDFLADAGREECFSLGGARLFVAHGDRYGVKYGLERLSYRAEELGARAALFGHTHAPFAGYAGGVLLVKMCIRDSICMQSPSFAKNTLILL